MTIGQINNRQNNYFPLEMKVVHVPRSHNQVTRYHVIPSWFIPGHSRKNPRKYHEICHDPLWYASLSGHHNNITAYSALNSIFIASSISTFV
jgi:hypothetical protein